MPIRSRFSLLELLFVLCFSIGFCTAAPKLQQVHVITRHGSRLQLTKDAESLQEGSPASSGLTPLGQKQLYDLGVWLKNRYPPLFQRYDPDHVLLESSAFDRTIVSASSLALGLFDSSARDPNSAKRLPDDVLPANIPVFTKSLVNDITIRGYDKCKNGLRLSELFASPDWMSLENQHLQLLTRLGNFPSFQQYADPTGKVELRSLWNVFDAIHVAKTECAVMDPTTSIIPDGCTQTMIGLRSMLTEAEWIELQEATYEAELMKYGTDKAGKLVGSNLLQHIIDRMAAPLDGGLDSGVGQFFLYSAHYPTILGMFATLQTPHADTESSVPYYGSALIFELFQDDQSGSQWVELLYKPGSDESGSHNLIPLTSVCDTDTGTNKCFVPQLQELLKGFTVAHWCEECGNDSADACLRVALTKAKLELATAKQGGDSEQQFPLYSRPTASPSKEPWSVTYDIEAAATAKAAEPVSCPDRAAVSPGIIAIIVIMSLLLFVFTLALTCVFLHAKRHNKRNDPNDVKIHQLSREDRMEMEAEGLPQEYRPEGEAQTYFEPVASPPPRAPAAPLDVDAERAFYA